MSIELHIERLVIDEVVLGSERPADVQATIKRELARRLAQPGALDTLRQIGAIDRLPTEPPSAPRHSRNSLGQLIGAAVDGGLGISSKAALPTHDRATQGHDHG